ncbi:hypothetical protein SKAU_G00059620 [Synaphobranchus kaupii]|uniref:Murine leukemia virus integrase C-terminal domain-containing protein n=1 Tax=Synaphobranchus kaupii TaxID=118154 RepID=A0A9Q1G4M2_SYNKA|nr:hypothetical protein SKAU_G00059620 [Synaphobranchus kaupii]
MPAPRIRGPSGGPTLEVLELELREYMKQLTAIHQTIFEQERANEQENAEEGHHLRPGDLVYVRKFRRRWNEQRREGPFRITRTSPTALQVEGSNLWYHLNHCTRAVGGEQENEQDEAQEGNDRRPPEQEGAESNVHQSEDREVQDRDNQPGPSGISTVPQLASSSAADRSPDSELPGDVGGRGARLERAELDRADRGADEGFGQLEFGDLYPTNGDSRPRDETDRPITPRDEVDNDDSD